MKSIGQKFIFSILKSFTAIVLLITVVHPHNIRAQFTEDFSDNEILNNPAWAGTTDHFIVTQGVLRLNAPGEAGYSYLVSQPGPLTLSSWEFTLQMSFNPSSTNFTRVYLMSDQADLKAQLNGYFVMIGNSADEISLYHQAGTTKTKIIDGVDGRVNLTEVTVKIKVTRDLNGRWELYSDVGLQNTFTLEGTALENSLRDAPYFGVECTFTSTRADKFSFDNFVLSGEVISDLEPPVVERITIVSPTDIEVNFNEPVENASAKNIENYLVDNNIGKPRTAELLSNQPVSRISFPNSFDPGRPYTLTVKNISDHAGNIMAEQSLTFAYYLSGTATWKTLIFSEFFPDPSPPTGLPEKEFVEIYNRGESAINLENYILSDGSTKGTFPSCTISPGEYLIVCAKADLPAYQTLGKAVAVSNFPSLNNSGDHLLLISSGGITIDSLLYSDTWYKNTQKKQGGWTLEIIDPGNICAEEENWQASEASSGGTPGAVNSVFAENPDTTGPVILFAHPASADTLTIVFNEKLNEDLPSPDWFSFSPGLQINHIAQSKNLREIRIHLGEALQTSTMFTGHITQVFDCAGNRSSDLSFQFAVAEKPDSLDVLVSEILFNPRPNGVDFIELYNNSQKFIDLTSLKIANTDWDYNVKNEKSIPGPTRLLRPGEYVALTPNIENIFSEYECEKTSLLETGLPSLNDDEGSVCVLDQDGKILDAAHYFESMHSAFVKDPEGVALERLSFTTSAEIFENWKSAGSVSGYATPGFQNSNHIELASDREIIIDPEIFVPKTGQPDFTSISFNLEQPGFMANIRIYDSRGLPIKTIAENEMLGAQTFLRWEGDRNDGSMARVGSYMIWIELFNADGVVKTFRKRVVIGGRF